MFYFYYIYMNAKNLCFFSTSLLFYKRIKLKIYLLTYQFKSYYYFFLFYFSSHLHQTIKQMSIYFKSCSIFFTSCQLELYNNYIKLSVFYFYQNKNFYYYSCWIVFKLIVIYDNINIFIVSEPINLQNNYESYNSERVYYIIKIKDNITHKYIKSWLTLCKIFWLKKHFEYNIIVVL